MSAYLQTKGVVGEDFEANEGAKEHKDCSVRYVEQKMPHVCDHIECPAGPANHNQQHHVVSTVCSCYNKHG